MIPKITSLFVLLSSALVGCGGGGSAAPAPTPVPVVDLASKYVGTWAECIPSTDRPRTSAVGAARVKETLVFGKTGETTLSYTFRADRHVALDCSDVPFSFIVENGSITLTGPKIVSGGISADWADVSAVAPIASSGKNTFYTNGTLLILGAGPNDANGYPSGIDAFISYKK